MGWDGRDRTSNRAEQTATERGGSCERIGRNRRDGKSGTGRSGESGSDGKIRRNRPRREEAGRKEAERTDRTGRDIPGKNGSNQTDREGHIGQERRTGSADRTERIPTESDVARRRPERQLPLPPKMRPQLTPNTPPSDKQPRMRNGERAAAEETGVMTPRKQQQRAHSRRTTPPRSGRTAQNKPSPARRQRIDTVQNASERQTAGDRRAAETAIRARRASGLTPSSPQRTPANRRQPDNGRRAAARRVEMGTDSADYTITRLHDYKGVMRVIV